jgi:hypothetical protein
VVRLLLVLVLSTGRRGVSLLRLRAATGGDGRGPGAEWSVVENLVVRFAFILNKMGVAVGGADASMPCQFLRQLDTFGAVDGGNEEMTEIVRSDFSFRINASLGNAALYEVPHITGGCFDDLIARLLAVVNKHGRGFGDRAGTEILTHSGDSPLGYVDDGGLISFADYDNLPLEEIHVIDMQTASLRDTQAAISQKQNIRSISKVLWVTSYSIHVIHGFLDSVHVWIDKVSGALEPILFISQIKEGRINAAVSASNVPVEPVYRRSVHSLSGFRCAGSSKQKFYIRFLRELRVIANDVGKLLQGALVGLVGLRFPRLAYEVQKGAYGIIQGNLNVLHNANYIREC